MTRKAPTTLSPVSWTRIRDAYLAGESAVVICEQFHISMAALRRRARENGWRRSDIEGDDDPYRSTPQVDLELYAQAAGLMPGSASDPTGASNAAPHHHEDDHDQANDDLDDPNLADFDDPAVLAEMSLMRAKREILCGHVVSALRWTRLYREMMAIAASQTRAAAALAAALAKAAAAGTRETLETPVSPCLAPSPSFPELGTDRLASPSPEVGTDRRAIDQGGEVQTTTSPSGEPSTFPTPAPLHSAARIAREKLEAAEKPETLETLETLETPVLPCPNPPSSAPRHPPRPIPPPSPRRTNPLSTRHDR